MPALNNSNYIRSANARVKLYYFFAGLIKSAVNGFVRCMYKMHCLGNRECVCEKGGESELCS